MSLAAQREAAENYCRLHGLDLAHVFADEGISGTRTDNRPGLRDAIQAASAARCVLIVHSLSRLARSTRDAIGIADQLAKAHADLVSISEKIDTTSGMGRFFFTTIAALAQLERDQISERTIAALAYMFVEIAAPKFQHVLGYGLNTAGGASGSPIIARNGKVIGVHNAGSYLNLQLQHKRVPVGFPFGQRVDLLRELVDGTAEANQVQRDRQWADRLAALAISPEASSSYYLRLHRRGRFSKHSPISIDSWWLTPADGDQLNVAQGYPLEPGTYLITAASTAWTNIDITVETAAPNWFTFELLGEEPSRVRKVTMLPNWRDSFLLFEVTEPIEVDLTLLVKSAFVQDEETLVKLYQLIPPPSPTPQPAP